jgi:hypothetical protein
VALILSGRLIPAITTANQVWQTYLYR